MSYAVMPLQDWQNIVDSVRAKTGKADALVSAQVPNEINSITGGGGGDASLNIAYGDTAPSDTSKLWVKTSEPNKVVVSSSVGSAIGEGDGSYQELNTAFSMRLYNAGSAVVGKKIYLFGGMPTGRYTKIECFNTETDTISTLPTVLETGRRDIGCAAVGKKIYLFGGVTTMATQLIECFNTEDETITTLSVKMPSNHGAVKCVAFDNVIYVCCVDGYGIYRFDTEKNTLVQVGNFGVAGYDAGVAIVGTKIYVVGGKSSSTSTTGGTKIQYYNFGTNTFFYHSTQLPVGLYSMGCVAIGSKIYIIGGATGSSTYANTIYCFDTITGNIRELSTTLPVGLKSMSCEAIGDGVYIMGGTSNLGVTTIGYFDSAAAVAVENGTLQIVNGENNFSLINTEEMKIEIGVGRVYKGNADGLGEKVEACLFKDDAWTII